MMALNWYLSSSKDKQMSEKISAFVISYDREKIIGTCLRALQFADEIILVDKSSTDLTVEIAKPLVDLVKIVPWSPTVEGTREYAESLCTHDWILFLDDDECLSIEAIEFIRNELKKPRALVYSFPLKHYICGIHSEDAYYWPEHHIRLYKKGAVKFGDSVHGSIQPQVEDIYKIPFESGICIHHFSHKDVGEWLEKANRYTSQLNRVRMHDPGAGSSIINYAHRAIDRWANKKPLTNETGYEAMVSVLRALYDIIDRLKCWSEFQITSQETFIKECLSLDHQYKIFYENQDIYRSQNLFKDKISPSGSETKNIQFNNNEKINSVQAALKIFDEERQEAGQLIESLEARNKELMQKMQEMHLIFEKEKEIFVNHNEVTDKYIADLEASNAEEKEKNRKEILFNIETEQKYQNSFSWRITRPLRKLAQLVSRKS